MKAVMPVAGLGSRFATVGITKPKPLIQVGNKPMVRWAADSIPFVNDDDFIFIVRQAHVDEYQIDDQLREIFSSSIDIHVIDYLTEGPACTARLAEKYVEPEESVIITDSDHYFENEAFCDLIQNETVDVDGAIPVFESEEEGLSYSVVNEEKQITEIKEKDRISKFANIGSYYFDQFGDFIRALDNMKSEKRKVNNEYYVAPAYNELIAEGGTVVARECSKVWSLGTPEDLERFQQDFL